MNKQHLKLKNSLFYFIIALLFLTSVEAKAQAQIISLGVDPELAINGAYDYDNTPVSHIHFSWVSRTSLNDEIGIKVSYADLKYDYFNFGFIYNKKINLLNLSHNCNRSLEVVETLVGAQVGMTQRNYPEFKTQKLYFDPQLNAQVRWWVTDIVGVYSKVNFSPRFDLDYYGKHKAIHYEVEIGLIANF
tara:strand:- start:4044 stop:4610 length:567 start_codon:yes stop_codon:yes gene_type:complete